jgi:hypothetical protein
MVPILAAALSGCAAGPPGDSGSGTIIGAGTFTLAPGQTRTIRVAYTYRVIRICNDVSSPGSLEGAVGDYPPVTMPPGVCNANTGDYSDRITVHNPSDATVTGLYQS